jgi:hypothetical protein
LPPTPTTHYGRGLTPILPHDWPAVHFSATLLEGRQKTASSGSRPRATTPGKAKPASIPPAATAPQVRATSPRPPNARKWTALASTPTTPPAGRISSLGPGAARWRRRTTSLCRGTWVAANGTSLGPAVGPCRSDVPSQVSGLFPTHEAKEALDDGACTCEEHYSSHKTKRHHQYSRPPRIWFNWGLHPMEDLCCVERHGVE